MDQPFDVRMARAEEKRKLNILRLKRQQWERHLSQMNQRHPSQNSGGGGGGGGGGGKLLLMNYRTKEQVAARKEALQARKKKQDETIHRLVHSKETHFTCMAKQRLERYTRDPTTGRQRFVVRMHADLSVLFVFPLLNLFEPCEPFLNLLSSF